MHYLPLSCDRSWQEVCSRGESLGATSVFFLVVRVQPSQTERSREPNAGHLTAAGGSRSETREKRSAVTTAAAEVSDRHRPRVAGTE